MILEYLQHMNHWDWWVLALVLVILEVFSPGVFFLWMGIAAGMVGLALLLWPEMNWLAQMLLFSVTSILSILAWRQFQRLHPVKTDQPTLNRRGEQYVGRTFTLEHPIVNGQGKIRVDDTTWKIHGEDCDAGGKVMVTGVEGTVLVVERKT